MVVVSYFYKKYYRVLVMSKTQALTLSFLSMLLLQSLAQSPGLRLMSRRQQLRDTIINETVNNITKNNGYLLYDKSHHNAFDFLQTVNMCG